MGHEQKYMGHETANWGGRGLGYMLFNVYLCNQPYYCKVLVEPETQICTLLEVWVLRVGMSTLGHKRLWTSRIGDSQVPMTLEYDDFRWTCFGLSEWTTLIVYKWLLKLIYSGTNFENSDQRTNDCVQTSDYTCTLVFTRTWPPKSYDNISCPPSNSIPVITSQKHWYESTGLGWHPNKMPLHCDIRQIWHIKFRVNTWNTRQFTDRIT